MRLSVFDASALLAEDVARAAQSGVLLRLEINRPVPGGPISPTTGGSWTTLPDGSAVWTLRLQAADANAVRVHLAQFDLEDDARVVVRGAAGAADAYRGKGPNRDGAFWAAATPGDSVYIEYFDPTGKRDVRLAINNISHLYRDPVGRVLFTVPEEGSLLCSGGLLNDADANTYAGYFLTANHCISGQATASSLTVYCFYQANSCSDSVPSLATRPKSIGATLLATSSQSDFTFMRLTTDPKDGQGFAAWTTTAPWSAVGLIHVFGSGIVPSSAYDVAVVGENCDPANESNYSAVLTVSTGMWGDVAASFQQPSPASRTQPNFADISAIVSKFKAANGAAIVARAMLQPNAPNPGALIGFSDISACVDAFRGVAYPYPGPSSCP